MSKTCSARECRPLESLRHPSESNNSYTGLCVCLCVCVCHCQLLSSQSGGCRRSEVREKKVDPMFRRCPCGSLCLCSQWVRHDPLRGRKNGGCGLVVMWVWFECCVSIQNRLEESLNLFQAICNNKFFVKTSMVCVWLLLCIYSSCSIISTAQ